MFAPSKERAAETTAAADFSALNGSSGSSAQRRMFTTPEAASYLQLSVTYLNKMRVSGSGPIFVKLGRSVRYRQVDLEAWIAARRFVSTSAAQVSQHLAGSARSIEEAHSRPRRVAPPPTSRLIEGGQQ
jgi:excisionase family DNA binding protein